MPKMLKIHTHQGGPYKRRFLNPLKTLVNTYLLNLSWIKENIRKKEMRMKEGCFELLPYPGEGVGGISELPGCSLVCRLNTT